VAGGKGLEYFEICAFELADFAAIIGLSILSSFFCAMTGRTLYAAVILSGVRACGALRLELFPESIKTVYWKRYDDQSGGENRPDYGR
jgi:hypothetical protein